MGFIGMKRIWQNQLIRLLGTTAFLTAAFFAGRQAAVMVDGYAQMREAAKDKDDYTKMQKYCVVIDAGHGGGKLRYPLRSNPCFYAVCSSGAENGA